MVWFQCEDCGENLKKPKLPNHFRICSATKLSCIDCGVMFGQDSVQSHNQCITEAEKYGPKGQGKATNGAIPKPGKDSKQQPDIDINVGLSQRPPWFCSLCNTSATSKQTLLGHADGKKHRAKARAFHAARQQTKQTEESAPDTNALIKSIEGLPDNRHPGEEKVQDLPKIDNRLAVSENEKVQSKKRKLGASANDLDKRNAEEGTESLPKKANHTLLKNDKTVETGHPKEDTKQKIKWKKLIKSALKSNPEGALKMKKLKKLVLKSLKESGVTEDENELWNILEQKVNSSSRFRVDEKFVHLAAKD